ncbi:MAG: glycosyltransferase family 4 protein [Anaerolineales bacterium]|jgi:glycosyltransferase involved in cell wall biosynthesis
MSKGTLEEPLFRMRILIVLTYYRPHYSGLTIYTERLAKALASRGHHVTVVTSQFTKELPCEEVVEGVHVVRLPVAFRISKGVVMPGMPYRARQEAQQADIVNLHLPQLDAAPIAVLSRLTGKPTVVTYHCDLQLPTGFVHALANLASNLANRISASFANLIVTNTLDYAQESNFLKRYLHKIQVIPPPVKLAQVDTDFIEETRKKFGVEPGQKVIGMATRLAAEKGAEYLVRALPEVLEKFPQARVLYAGQHENVMGEEAYAAVLAPLIQELGDRWKFLGLLPDDELAAFFHICDVLAVPSTNSTESFSMVQVEAMTCGTPAVASNLPGMRQPILQTGMGLTFPMGDSDALASALTQVLNQPQAYRGDVPEITRRFSPETIAGEYEALFKELLP